MTLIELLLVIGIVALLLQLMFPAIHAARQSARRLICTRKLRDLGAAMVVHHDAIGRLPSGGWHYTWVGEPERGTGPDQPGSWAYNLLDYLDHSSLRAMGKGVHDESARAAEIAERCRIPLSEFLCPERREPAAYPHTWNREPISMSGRLPVVLTLAAKTDYAANVGDSAACEFDSQWLGPESLEEGDLPGFVWPETHTFNGIVFGRSQVRFKQVRDGTSKTYLIGEKYVDSNRYQTGDDWGDNENLYAGFNNDSCRSSRGAPQPDQPGVDYRNQFGSAHRSVWQVVMCDGSVQSLGFDIDPEIHRRQGTRADGAQAMRSTADQHVNPDDSRL